MEWSDTQRPKPSSEVRAIMDAGRDESERTIDADALPVDAVRAVRQRRALERAARDGRFSGLPAGDEAWQ